MEILVDRDTLSAEIGRVGGVVDDKNPFPILHHILIHPTLTSLKLTASNLESTFYCQSALQNITGEDTFVSLAPKAKKLLDVLRVIPPGPVSISTDASQWIHIKAGGTKFRIPGADPKSFPELPKIPAKDEWIFIPVKNFRNALKGVSFAMDSSENPQYAMNGIQLEFSGSDLRFVALDGRRLSLAEGSSDTLLFDAFKELLPAKGVSELAKMLSDYEGEVGVVFKENNLMFSAGDRYLSCRKMVGLFPDYRKLLEFTYQTSVTIKADVLAQSTKRAMVVADKKLAIINLKFTTGKIEISSQLAEEGECNEVVESNYQGEEKFIACSARLLNDFLQQMGSAEIKFEFADSKTPLLFTTVQDGISVKYVLMPSRTAQDK